MSNVPDSLVISVRLHEGWYHGAGSLPSPARVFQALVAGRGLSGPIPDQSIQALEWLERQQPPIMAVPVTRGGQPVATFVPNNDLDAKQGDHRRIGEIRTKKSIRPLLFDADVPFVYCWKLGNATSDDRVHVEQVCELAQGVFQLGRAVDAAWAWAELLTVDELDERLRLHRGPVLHPSSGQGNTECPTPGSIASLLRRHSDLATRYGLTADGKGQTFRRRGKPKWRLISYDSNVSRVSFDLIDRQTGTLAHWPTTEVTRLVKTIRDKAVERLCETLPTQQAEVRQVLIGRTARGENAGSTQSRVRIIPLPSIGHQHADQLIRRVAIEVPGRCAIRADDVAWAFSGQTIDRHDRELDLVRSQPHRQLEHYGVDSEKSRLWQTVTSIALTTATRRRVQPNLARRTSQDEKGTAERRLEQEVAASALRQALRHAGVSAKLTRLRLQKEPLTTHGRRAEDFAVDDRFNKHALWHAELEFMTAINGPLLLGDGRFLGLGLLHPTAASTGVFAFTIESGLADDSDPVRLALALRRAVMARVRDVLKTSHLPTYFSGHSEHGTPADSTQEPHLTYAFDPEARRLLILQPEVLDHSIRPVQRYRNTLESAMASFEHLRAGPAGHLHLAPINLELSRESLFCESRTWTSLTPYSINRHAKKTTVKELIQRDVLAECERRGLPRPKITVKDWKAIAGSGLQGRLTLEFKHAIAGPIFLGKTRHHGGGVFSAVRTDR